MKGLHLEYAYGGHPPGHPYEHLGSFPPRRWVRLNGGPWFEDRGAKWHEVHAAMALLQEAFEKASDGEQGLVVETKKEG